MRQVLGPGALGRPRGSGWRGKWEGGSGWGTHVNPWLFHFNVWQNSLQIKKINKVIFLLSWYINHNITVFGFILVRETTGTSSTFNSFCSTFPDHPPEWVLSVYMPTVSLQESLFPHSLATKLGNFHSFNCCQSDRGEWLSHACFHFISLITGEAGHVFQPHPILLQSSFGARWGSLHVFQLHFILLDSINHSFLLR